MLSCLRLFNSSLHHSFGSKEERAHLVFPFHVLPDNLSVVPSSERPPDLTLGELPAGKSSTSSIELGFIYTLSFYSQYVDFESWTICRGACHVVLSRFPW
jgi:hypothetical protein